MLNFSLGLVAGGAIMAVALGVGLRQPVVLDRLDLMTKPDPAVALVRRSEPACPPKTDTATTSGGGRPALLFDPKRFWAVAP